MLELLHIIFKWRKSIIGVTLLATAISVVGSLLMPDYYLSEAVVAPINPNVFDRTNIFSKSGTDRAVYYFGGRAEIDRMISIGESNKMNDFLIEEFNLYDHYEIDTTKKYAAFKMLQKIRENVKIVKDDKSSALISVLDTDPFLASTMVEKLIEELDIMNRNVLLEKQIDLKDILEEQIENKLSTVISLEDSLKQAIFTNPLDTVTSNLINERLENELNDYNDMSSAFFQYQALAKQQLSTLYIYEAPRPADRKDKPKRSLIVIGALIGAFLLMSLCAVVIEKYNEYSASIKS